MKKKIVSLCLVIALIAITVIGASLAYFTDTDSKENVFTVGNVDIELTEPNWNANNAKDLYPGQTVAKDPTVKNTGANPCYVRVKVEGLDSLSPAGAITLNGVDTKWVKGTDGYYYYTEVLAADETTPAVFESFTLPTDLENGDGTNKTIKVSAEAIQSEGFASYTAAFAAYDAE